MCFARFTIDYMYEHACIQFTLGANSLPSNIKQKSPGITMEPLQPKPFPGEDNVSYERHLKTLQVSYGLLLLWLLNAIII